MATNPLNIFLLNVNFDKFTIELHFLIISLMFAKFLEDQKSLVALLIKYLNFKFCSLKLCIKNKSINRRVNNI